MSKHTPGTWHVNATKDGRIVGDETAESFDKLYIHGGNCTIATVYRSRDARLIATAPELLNDLRAATEMLSEAIKYANEMRAIGRGTTFAGRYGYEDKDMLAAFARTIAKAEGKGE